MRIAIPGLLCLLCFLPSSVFAQDSTAQTQVSARAPSASETAHAELARIEQRMAEIQDERSKHPLTGPIVVMAGGFAVGIGLAFGTVIHWGASNFEYGEIQRVSKSDATITRRLALSSVVSLLVGAGGATWFATTMKARRALWPEMKDLRQRKRELTTGLGLSFETGGANLSLQGRF